MTIEDLIINIVSGTPTFAGFGLLAYVMWQFANRLLNMLENEVMDKLNDIQTELRALNERLK